MLLVFVFQRTLTNIGALGAAGAATILGSASELGEIATHLGNGLTGLGVTVYNIVGKKGSNWSLYTLGDAYQVTVSALSFISAFGVVYGAGDLG